MSGGAVEDLTSLSPVNPTLPLTKNQATPATHYVNFSLRKSQPVPPSPHC